MQFALFGMTFVSLLVFISVTLLKLTTWRVICKVITSLLFLATGIAAHKKNKENKTYHYFILIGLFLSVLGDTFLAFTPMLAFIIGAICFAIGHICFLLGFCSLQKLKWLDGIVFALIMIGSSIMFTVGKFDFKNMFPLIISYLIIISLMVSKAIVLWITDKEKQKAIVLAVIGVVMFWVSDAILLFAKFGIDVWEHLGILNALVYYTGQALLAISLGWSIQMNKGKVEKQSTK